jgi:dual specificity MAP kinase phosphatase
MPDSADSVDIVSNEQLLEMILAATPKLIILDLRTFSEFQISKIRNSVNFSIPSILKKRLIAGKIDLCSTIKSEKLKEKIISNYRENIFVLYNDCAEDDLIYVLNRKLKQDGVMNVKILESKY